MKRNWFTLFTLLLVLAAATSAASAAPADRTSYETSLAQVCGIPGTPACTPTPPPPRDVDGDGVPDESDGCPTVPGPASNGGCPENTPVPAPGDRDGDGTPDDVDRCPDVGGHAANGGCPLEGEVPTGVPTAADIPTAVPTITLPDLPTTGECALATLTADRVNVRGEPSLEAAIVGALDPTLLYAVIAILENSEGLWARIGEGWVASWVVRMGGACDMLPYVNMLGGPDTTPGPDDLSGFEFEVVGGAPSTGAEEVACTNNLHIAGRVSVDPSNPNSVGFVINWNIGGPIIGTLIGEAIGATAYDPNDVNSVSDEDAAASEQNIAGIIAPCIKPDPNSEGFIIDWQPPPEGDTPGGIAPPDPDAQGFIINWYAGGAFGDGSVLPTEQMVIAIIQPPPNGDQPPVMIVWQAPPEPDAPEGIIIDFNIGWTAPPEGDMPQGFVIDWTVGGIILPCIVPGETAEAGAPCNAQGEVSPPEGDMPQGIIIIGGIPGGVDPDAQGFVVDWFPNGVDPDEQGIIIIGGMPGGVDPGAQAIILHGMPGENDPVQIQFHLQKAN